MARKATAASFLKNMGLGEGEGEAPAVAPAKPARQAKGEAEAPRTYRETRKHLGGHYEPEFVEKFMVLRARTGLTADALIRRAIDELYARENAARKFGDR